MIVASGAATNALDRLRRRRVRRTSRVVPGRGEDAPTCARSSAASQALPPTARRTASTARSRCSPARGHGPPGTFVFVLSDFLPLPGASQAARCPVAAGWDVVPVVVQDPSGSTRSRRSAVSRCPWPIRRIPARSPLGLSRKGGHRPPPPERAAHRAPPRRPARSRADHVTITSSDRATVHASFLSWAEGRRARSRSAR